MLSLLEYGCLALVKHFNFDVSRLTYCIVGELTESQLTIIIYCDFGNLTEIIGSAGNYLVLRIIELEHIYLI